MEYYKNVLRLTGRIIDFVMHIVDLYYIQKEIKALVKSNYKLKIDV